MEATSSISILYARLDLVQVAIIGLVLFALGYYLGHMATKKMTRQMAKMEKKIMDLNTELLYGPDGQHHHA